VSLALTRKLAASQEWLDTVADGLQPAVQGILSRSPALRDLLDGRWLGAPLHPALTDVPLGAWTAAALLDLRDSEDGGGAADGALAVGVLAALPTALTGLSDWSTLRGEQRRIGSLHAVLNSVGLSLAVASLACRAANRRGVGRSLSLAGLLATLTAAHLGGQLSFGLGVRVNRTAWESGGEEFVSVLMESALAADELRRVEVEGVPVVLARSQAGDICAIAATCTHLGGPLDEGKREGDTVTCPWHGSRFDLCSGEVLASPAVFPQPRYEARVRAGSIELRRTD
jgi:nitrite reductase/ring-hydroxylating ferredoxin subunit